MTFRKTFIPLMLGMFTIPFATARTSRLIDDNWKFTLLPDSLPGAQPLSGTVDLPHDWSIELPFDRNAPAGFDGAYLPTGKGVYVKHIDIDGKDLKDKRHTLLFEGVYERWTLSVNGNKVGFRPYGYSSVMYDITPYLHPGENVIEVTVDNSNQKNCRWYAGSGIYRHVRHIVTDDTFVEPWSLFISTPSVSRQVANVAYEFEVGGLADPGSLSGRVTVIENATGKRVASENIDIHSPEVKGELVLADPELWSPDSPSLYTMRIEILREGDAIDEFEQIFGIREIAFSAEGGLLLNGESIVLNGACVHHDNGILGAASYDAAEARKVRLLKEAGFNAVRTSHNPPAPAFLDECDRQGLLVIDEAFDGWRDAKNPGDYHNWIDEWGVRDVGDMVRRDRNHPSVMAWSIGNEVIERKHIGVLSTARSLAAECRRLDPTRPVTEALCAWDSDWEIYDPHAEELDIVGYNYMIHKSETDHQRCPDRVMWQTESYPKDAASNWHKVMENPYIIGDFVWTGIDYLGESGIGRYHYKGETEGEHYQRDQWPWHGAYCGDVDITGWRKPVSHYRDMLYNPEKMLYLAVREPDGYYGEVVTTMWGVWPTWESWNWTGHEGKPVEVEVMSRYPKVRLYLNDKLIGEKEAGEANDCLAIFKVDYAPGVIKAVGVDAAGDEVEATEIATAGEPAALRLVADKPLLVADNQDLAFVTVEIVDKNGRVVPDAAVPVTFSVYGPAVIKGAGSADLKSMERYTDPYATTWKGRALVALKSTRKKGEARLTAKAPGMKKATFKLRLK